MINKYVQRFTPGQKQRPNSQTRSYLLVSMSNKLEEMMEKQVGGYNG